MTQLLVFLSLVSFSFSTFAADLSEVDNFLKNPKFTETFVLKDFAEVRNESCISASFCDTYEASVVVVARDAQSAKLEVWDAGGKKQSVSLTERQWQEISGNYLRAAIRTIESFGMQVFIEQVRPTTYSLEINRQKVTIPALEIIAHAQNQLKLTKHLRWIVGRDVGGVAQILVREQSGKNGQMDRTQVLSFSRSAQRANF